MDQYQKASKEYLIELLSSLKKNRKAIESRQAEYETWSSRVRLAREKGREDLLSQAQLRMEEAAGVLERLKYEEGELLKEYRQAQTKYNIESALPEQSIDADALLQALQSIGGKEDPLEKEIQMNKVDSELEALKRELKKEQSE